MIRFLFSAAVGLDKKRGGKKKKERTFMAGDLPSSLLFSFPKWLPAQPSICSTSMSDWMSLVGSHM